MKDCSTNGEELQTDPHCNLNHDRGTCGVACEGRSPPDRYMGGCQNYGPFLGSLIRHLVFRGPKRGP